MTSKRSKLKAAIVGYLLLPCSTESLFCSSGWVFGPVKLFLPLAGPFFCLEDSCEILNLNNQPDDDLNYEILYPSRITQKKYFYHTEMIKIFFYRTIK